MTSEAFEERKAGRDAVRAIAGHLEDRAGAYRARAGTESDKGRAALLVELAQELDTLAMNVRTGGAFEIASARVARSPFSGAIGQAALGAFSGMFAKAMVGAMAPLALPASVAQPEPCAACGHVLAVHALRTRKVKGRTVQDHPCTFKGCKCKAFHEDDDK